MIKEDSAPTSFAADVDKTLSAIGAAAKTAAGKFSDARKKAEADLKKSTALATHAAATGKKDPASGTSRGGAISARRLDLANFIVEGISRLPTLNDMNAFGDLNASELQDLIVELTKVQSELVNFSRVFIGVLKSGNFLMGNELKDTTLGDILKPVDGTNAVSRMDAAIEANPRNLAGALKAVILDPSLSTTSRTVMAWLNSQNEYNKKVNDSKAMSANRDVGPNLARMFHAYVQQIIVPRLETMEQLMSEYENKPITQEHLAAVRRLLERL